MSQERQQSGFSTGLILALSELDSSVFKVKGQSRIKITLEGILLTIQNYTLGLQLIIREDPKIG